MPVNQEILRVTIQYFIWWDRKTTTQRITTYFGLSYRAFHTLLKDESEFENIISKFYKLANIDVGKFKQHYYSIIKFKNWEAEYVLKLKGYKQKLARERKT